MQLLGLANQLGQVGHCIIPHMGSCLERGPCGQVRTLPTPAQLSDCPPLTVVSTCRMVSMCHRLLGANLEDMAHQCCHCPSPQAAASDSQPFVTYLSAANRMPEAQSARRSGGQDSRKACSSFIMARTLELFTRARLSSRARLERERGIHADSPGYPVLAFLFPGTFSFSSYARCSELV